MITIAYRILVILEEPYREFILIFEDIKPSAKEEFIRKFI